MSSPPTPEGPAFLSKFSFLPLLQRAAAAQPSVQVTYGQTVVGMEHDDDGVAVLVEDLESGSIRALRTAYLVGCDGGRSWVRKRLGIEFVGDFAQGRNFAVHFRAPALMELLREHADGVAAQIQTLANESRPYITVVDGADEWRLSVYLDRDPSPEDAVRWVHAAIGKEIDVQILRSQPWSGHRVVAERYRDGRVFLAGDAAHLLWPKGGFGANTGIGDAVDLGWKLAAVLSGWGGEALLNSYEVERRPIAVRNVSEASSNWTSDAKITPDPILDSDNADGAAARTRMGALIRSLRGREFRSIGVQLGHRYRNSPIVVPDGGLEPPDESDNYVPSTWPGCRAPHVWLPDGSSVLDRFGHGFVLIATADATGTTAGIQKLEQAATVRGVPLEAFPCGDAQLHEIYGNGLVLVRPDGHVCWRGDALPEDPGALLDVVRGARGHGAEVLETPSAGRSETALTRR